ncbi:uncharacterized protein BN452_01094 [Clostridium sp. CAG:1013]|nr:uncharacterized protein BN452_01094 [Clostridium sp. CAG:1013]
MDQDVLFFFEKAPDALPLYQTLEQKLQEILPDMTLKVGKSQISFYLGHQFGCASLLAVRRKKDLPSPYLTVTFGLAYPVEHPRIAAKTQPYPNRWTHHVVIGQPKDVDEVLLAWLKEAAEFAATK